MSENIAPSTSDTTGKLPPPSRLQLKIIHPPQCSTNPVGKVRPIVCPFTPTSAPQQMWGPVHFRLPGPNNPSEPNPIVYTGYQPVQQSVGHNSGQFVPMPNTNAQNQTFLYLKPVDLNEVTVMKPVKRKDSSKRPAMNNTPATVIQKRAPDGVRKKIAIIPEKLSSSPIETKPLTSLPNSRPSTASLEALVQKQRKLIAQLVKIIVKDKIDKCSSVCHGTARHESELCRQICRIITGSQSRQRTEKGRDINGDKLLVQLRKGCSRDSIDAVIDHCKENSNELQGCSQDTEVGEMVGKVEPAADDMRLKTLSNGAVYFQKKKVSPLKVKLKRKKRGRPKTLSSELKVICNKPKKVKCRSSEHIQMSPTYIGGIAVENNHRAQPTPSTDDRFVSVGPEYTIMEHAAETETSGSCGKLDAAPIMDCPELQKITLRLKANQLPLTKPECISDSELLKLRKQAMELMSPEGSSTLNSLRREFSHQLAALKKDLASGVDEELEKGHAQVKMHTAQDGHEYTRSIATKDTCAAASSHAALTEVKEDCSIELESEKTVKSLPLESCEQQIVLSDGSGSDLQIIEPSASEEKGDPSVKKEIIDGDWLPASMHDMTSSPADNSCSVDASDGDGEDEWETDSLTSDKKAKEKKKRLKNKGQCHSVSRTTRDHGVKRRRSPRKRYKPPESYIRRSASKQASKKISTLLMNKSTSSEFSDSSDLQSPDAKQKSPSLPDRASIKIRVQRTTSRCSDGRIGNEKANKEASDEYIDIVRLSESGTACNKLDRSSKPEPMKHDHERAPALFMEEQRKEPVKHDHKKVKADVMEGGQTTMTLGGFSFTIPRSSSSTTMVTTSLIESSSAQGPVTTLSPAAAPAMVSSTPYPIDLSCHPSDVPPTLTSDDIDKPLDLTSPTNPRYAHKISTNDDTEVAAGGQAEALDLSNCNTEKHDFATEGSSNAGMSFKSPVDAETEHSSIRDLGKYLAATFLTSTQCSIEKPVKVNELGVVCSIDPLTKNGSSRNHQVSLHLEHYGSAGVVRSIPKNDAMQGKKEGSITNTESQLPDVGLLPPPSASDGCAVEHVARPLPTDAIPERLVGIAEISAAFHSGAVEHVGRPPPTDTTPERVGIAGKSAAPDDGAVLHVARLLPPNATLERMPGNVVTPAQGNDGESMMAVPLHRGALECIPPSNRESTDCHQGAPQACIRTDATAGIGAPLVKNVDDGAGDKESIEVQGQDGASQWVEHSTTQKETGTRHTPATVSLDIDFWKQKMSELESSQDDCLDSWFPTRKVFPSTLFSVARGHGMGFLQERRRRQRSSKALAGSTIDALRKVNKAKLVWRSMAKTGKLHRYVGSGMRRRLCRRQMQRQRAVLTLAKTTDAEDADDSCEEEKQEDTKREKRIKKLKKRREHERKSIGKAQAWRITNTTTAPHRNRPPFAGSKNASTPDLSSDEQGDCVPDSSPSFTSHIQKYGTNGTPTLRALERHQSPDTSTEPHFELASGRDSVRSVVIPFCSPETQPRAENEIAADRYEVCVHKQPQNVTKDPKKAQEPLCSHAIQSGAEKEIAADRYEACVQKQQQKATKGTKEAENRSSAGFENRKEGGSKAQGVTARILGDDAGVQPDTRITAIIAPTTGTYGSAKVSIEDCQNEDVVGVTVELGPSAAEKAQCGAQNDHACYEDDVNLCPPGVDDPSKAARYSDDRFLSDIFSVKEEPVGSVLTDFPTAECSIKEEFQETVDGLCRESPTGERLSEMPCEPKNDNKNAGKPRRRRKPRKSRGRTSIVSRRKEFAASRSGDCDITTTAGDAEDCMVVDDLPDFCIKHQRRGFVRNESARKEVKVETESEESDTIDLAELTMIPRKASSKAKMKITQQLAKTKPTLQKLKRDLATQRLVFEPIPDDTSSEDELPPVTWLNLSKSSSEEH